MKKSYITLIVLMASVLFGCVEWQVGKQAVSTYGAQIADEKFDVVMWTLCNATSIGSIRRNIGTSTDRAEAYNKLCAEHTVDVVKAVKETSDADSNNPPD